MLNILKSPESCIKPMRSADFSDTHWTASLQTRNRTRLKDFLKYTSQSLHFLTCRKVKVRDRETGWPELFEASQCPLWTHERTEKIKKSRIWTWEVHSQWKASSTIKSRYSAGIPEGLIWYKSNSDYFSLQHTPLFNRCLSLSLCWSLFFKQLKSDYSSPHCDRNPHESTPSITDSQSSTSILAGGETCQFFLIGAVALLSTCRSCSLEATARCAKPFILKLPATANVQCRGIHKLWIGDGMCLG